MNDVRPHQPGSPSDDELVRQARNLGRRLLLFLPIYAVVFGGFAIVRERVAPPPAATRQPSSWLVALLIVVPVVVCGAVVWWIFTRQLGPGSSRVLLLAHRVEVQRIYQTLRRGQPVRDEDRELAVEAARQVERNGRAFAVLPLVGVVLLAALLLLGHGRVWGLWFGLLAVLVVTFGYAWRERRRVLASASEQGLLA